MARVTSRQDIDILYVGIVLGHGGDAVQMLDLAAGVAALGSRVKVVVPAVDTTVSFAERCRSRGVFVERSPLLRVSAAGSRQNLLHLVRLFRANPASVVHFHTGDVCLPRSVQSVIRLLNLKPALVTVHSPYSSLEPGSGRALRWAECARDRLDAVLCPSNNSRRLQISYGLPPERVQVIYNCIDVDRMSCGDPGAPRQSLGIPAEDRLIVFSSRLDRQKRPLYAVQSFAAVAAEFPKARLVFVGRGDSEDETRALAGEMGVSDRVHFLGFQTNVADWLAASDVWLLPTDAENFSIAVLEALAAGCAIVSTECSGNDEVLVDGENALLAPVGDVPALTAALRRVLSDEPLRQRLRRMARATADDYTIDKMVNAYTRLYNECLGVLPSLRGAAVQPERSPAR